MKAILPNIYGGPEVLKLGEVADPVVRPRDLLVRVHACGVNRADLIQRAGHYANQSFGDSEVMGLELAGEVIALGDETHGFKKGDRVMGIVGGGAYAEIARIDFEMAMSIPSDLSYEQAAAIPEVFVTAHEALFHLGQLSRGGRVLIHAAASGVGSAAVQLAKARGATVFATASTNKVAEVKSLGADFVIDYKSESFASTVASKTDNQGVNVIVDFIGAPYFDDNIASLAPGGRLIQVGLMGGAKGVTLPLDKLLYKHIQIIGTVMKSRTPEEKRAMTARFHEAWLPGFTAAGLRPVIDSKFPLEKASEAHARMESNLNTGKILLVPLSGAANK